MLKREHQSSEGAQGALIKKVRYEDESSSSGNNAVMEYKVQSGQLVASKKTEVTRTSSLQAPTMHLTGGHEKAVYSIAFDPSGQHLASAGFDKNIVLWDVYGDCANYNVLSGHKNAVLQIQWASNGKEIISCSADKTVSVWDSNKGVRTRKLTDHDSIVNSVSVAKNNPFIFASGSDDSTVKIWDSRCKWSVQSYEHDYQVTAVAISDSGENVFTGGIDNIIRKWDIKAEATSSDMDLEGHMDTITGLAISPNGTHLLSNAMDSTLRKWDIRPFAGGNRCIQMYEGGHHGAEKGLLKASWSADGEMVSCGSADRIVHIWDATSAKQLFYLPGHKGATNEVIFHEKEPIIASCSSDKTIFIGELMSEQ